MLARLMSAAETSPGAVLLEARNICKSFPGVKALDHVGITVRAGRLNALLGENGAGKSTLMGILAGVLRPDEGEILLDGTPVSFRRPREAREAGISIIFQELNLLPNLSIAENIFLGREPRNALGVVNFGAMEREAAKWLGELELDADPRTETSRLRVGSQQIVEIAKALSFNSRVIIMDEPTSALTEQEVEVLFRLIDRLKQRGVGIIYITHKLDEIPRIADDITVLRDGRFIASQPLSTVTKAEMIRLMVGRELSEQFPKKATAPGAEVLGLDRVSLRHPKRPQDYVVRDVSLSVRRGEVVGLFGLMGAGRTELLQTVFGLHPKASSGEVRIDGRTARIKSPGDAVAAGLALAPEDRKAEGLVLPMSVAENATLSCLKTIASWGILREGRERSLVAGYVDRLRIKTPSQRQKVLNLSGGNQQKVVLAKWLATSPKVLMLDEPTRGIDINAKREIYTLIEEAAANGLGVLMVSSELPEILAIADRIVVLAEGRKTAEFSRAEATSEGVLQAALPTGRKR